MCTLQRQAFPEVPKLPRSSQRTISWSGGTKWVLAGRWEWNIHSLGRQGQSRVAPKDHGVCAELQVWGLVGSPGRCQRMGAAILTGGPALPTWLDGVALISGGTAGGESRLSVALPRPHRYNLLPPTPAGLSTSHSGGLYSLGHMHHTWLGHLCPGSRYLRICGDQVDRTWSRAAMMSQARSPTSLP